MEMPLSPKIVWITRAIENAQPFADDVNLLGAKSLIAPLGALRALDFQNEFEIISRSIIANPLKFAFIFSSVNGLQSYLNTDLSIMKDLDKIIAFCVGDTTANIAIQSGKFSQVFYPSPPNSYSMKGLIETVKEQLDQPFTLIHFSGEDQSHSPAEAFKIQGHEYFNIINYKMEIMHLFPDEVLPLWQLGQIDIVTLFSSRFASGFMNLVRQHPLPAKVPIICCLSQQIRFMLDEQIFPYILVCEKANSTNMLELIEQIMKREMKA